MTKETYVRAQMEISEFETGDVIRTSVEYQPPMPVYDPYEGGGY